MAEDIRSLLDALASTTDFEPGAHTLLRTLHTRFEALRAELPAPFDRGKLLRLLLHLRNRDTYEALAAYEPPSRRRDDSTSPSAMAPSTTAWRLVSETRGPALLDVVSGRTLTAGGAEGTSPESPIAVSLSSREIFRARDATHLLAFPLALATGAVRAMATLELRCQPALGLPMEPLLPAIAPLGLLAEVAGPKLLARPHEVLPAPEADPLLPVVGRRTARLIDTLGKFADFDFPILLLGETGVGKTHLARWCHERSPRRAGPFEVVHLASIPETLLEGELFGWKKGAHEGAKADRKGVVAQADGGTLFIDEIDRASLAIQDKLLRLLDSGHYRRLGDDAEQQADVRIIVAGNADFGAAIEARTFRQDLYFRISDLPVEVPPLAARLDEIAGWANHILRGLAHSRGEGEVALAAEAVQRLEGHGWPGNLRELAQVMRRAYIFAASEAREGSGRLIVGGEHLDRAMGGSGERRGLPDRLRDAARAFLAENGRRAERGLPPLPFDGGKVFGSYVLDEAIARKSPEEALPELGLEGLLKGRNHHQTLRRERERLQAFESEVDREG